MKRITGLLFLTQFLILGVALHAQENHGWGDRKRGDEPSKSATPDRKAPVVRRSPARQPIAIHTERPGNRPARNNSTGQGQSSVPATRPSQDRHRPSNTVGYDRERLSRIGVRSQTRRGLAASALLRTDRSHSTIRYPRTGPKGESIRGSLVSPRRFNNSGVRSQMSLVSQSSYTQRFDRERRSENQRNRSYWHYGNGFNYNHYVDYSGYHWYGWYRGDQYFWTRNYEGRWWWYDSGYGRWCYYEDNNWYWQDPYQQDEIYVYDNDSYISLSLDFHN